MLSYGKMKLVPYGSENVRALTQDAAFMTDCMRDGIGGLITFFVKSHENECHHNIRLVRQNQKHLLSIWDGVRWVKMRHDDGMQMLIDDVVEIFENWFVEKFGSDDEPDMDMVAAERFIMEVVSPSGNFWDNAYFVDPDDARVCNVNHPENVARKAQMTAEMTSALMAIVAQ